MNPVRSLGASLSYYLHANLLLPDPCLDLSPPFYDSFFDCSYIFFSISYIPEISATLNYPKSVTQQKVPPAGNPGSFLTLRENGFFLKCHGMQQKYAHHSFKL